MPKSKSPTKAEKAVSSHEAALFPPLTITIPALLVDGSDSTFRDFLGSLLNVGSQAHELRSFIAKHLGVSEPQYRLILAIAQLQKDDGVSVGVVAERLWVSTNFVTMEVRKLQSIGWVEKRQNPEDGRSVLLILTPSGRAAFMEVVSIIQLINDTMFDGLTMEELEVVGRVAKKLVQQGRRALDFARAKSFGDEVSKSSAYLNTKMR